MTADAVAREESPAKVRGTTRTVLEGGCSVPREQRGTNKNSQKKQDRSRDSERPTISRIECWNFYDAKVMAAEERHQRESNSEPEHQTAEFLRKRQDFERAHHL